jgi:hypothetical protein
LGNIFNSGNHCGRHRFDNGKFPGDQGGCRESRKIVTN